MFNIVSDLSHPSSRSKPQNPVLRPAVPLCSDVLYNIVHNRLCMSFQKLYEDVFNVYSTLVLTTWSCGYKLLELNMVVCCSSRNTGIALLKCVIHQMKKGNLKKGGQEGALVYNGPFYYWVGPTGLPNAEASCSKATACEHTHRSATARKCCSCTAAGLLLSLSQVDISLWLTTSILPTRCQTLACAGSSAYQCLFQGAHQYETLSYWQSQTASDWCFLFPPEILLWNQSLAIPASPTMWLYWT